MYYKLRCNSTQFVIYYKLRNYYKLQRNSAHIAIFLVLAITSGSEKCLRQSEASCFPFGRDQMLEEDIEQLLILVWCHKILFSGFLEPENVES